MAFWNTPDHMNGAFFSVVLQNQAAGPFGVIGVIFQNLGFFDGFDDLIHEYMICRQFVIPVAGDKNMTVFDQFNNLSECCTFGHRSSL